MIVIYLTDALIEMYESQIYQEIEEEFKQGLIINRGSYIHVDCDEPSHQFKTFEIIYKYYQLARQD